MTRRPDIVIPAAEAPLVGRLSHVHDAATARAAIDRLLGHPHPTAHGTTEPQPEERA